MTADHAAVLAQMAQRRIDAMQHRLRRDIAVRLLEETGSVTAEQVAEVFAAEWVPPDPRQLADMVAAKAAAAVAYAREEAEQAQLVVARLEAKAAKFAALLASVEETIAEAHAYADEGPARVEAALALLAAAQLDGDATSAPPPAGTDVLAQVAEVKGGR